MAFEAEVCCSAPANVMVIKLTNDVRRNPWSRKFGFSLKILSTVLLNLSIDYAHFPELGIASQKRKHLNSREDYAELFAEYNRALPHKKKGLTSLKNEINTKRRVALTCFEADHNDCHRQYVSHLLHKRHRYEVKHL